MFGVCVVKSQLKVLVMTENLLTEEIFWVEQAPSAEVIYNDAVHSLRRTADSKGNRTQRYYLM